MNEFDIATAISRLETFSMPYGAEKEIEYMISDKLTKMGIYHHSTSRVKTKESLGHKIGSGKYNTNKKTEDYSLECSDKIQDLIGIRILVYFVEDINIVEKVLEDMFGKGAWSKSNHSSGEFDPTKVNGVFRLNKALRVNGSERWNDICVDDTFEVQIKTVLFQSWHEIEHDMRYKNKELWKDFDKMGRKFNSILATLELCDDSVTSILEDLSYSCYKKAQEEVESDVWYLESVIKTHLRIKLQSTRKVFSDFLDNSNLDYDLELDDAIKKCDGKALFKRYLTWKINTLEEDEINHLIGVFSSKSFMKRVIKTKRNSVALKLIDYDNLPLNVFTISILVYLYHYQYKDSEPDDLNVIKDKLYIFLRREKNFNKNVGRHICKFKTYPIFQRRFDVYPAQHVGDEISSEKVFRNTFNYIKKWLADKLDDYDFGDEERTGFDKFCNLFDDEVVALEEDRYEFTLSSEYDIRALYVPKLKTAAIKIAEPGSDSIGNDRQFGRFYFTNISISDNGSFVELAVKVECQEPEKNIIKAVSTRPIFIHELFKDNDIDITEHGVGLSFKWFKKIDDKGKFTSRPYVINLDGDEELNKIKNVFFEDRRDILPVIFVNVDKLKSFDLSDNVSKPYFSINYLTDRMFGYAHVISYNNENVDKIKEIFKDNDKVKAAIEDSSIFAAVDKGYSIECFNINDYRDYIAFSKKVEEYIKTMMTERTYSFDNVLFFRELKNAYYKSKSNERDTIIGLEKEIEELKKAYEQKIDELNRRLKENNL